MSEPIFTRQFCIRLSLLFTLFGGTLIAMSSPQTTSESNYPSFKPVTAVGIGLLAIGSGGDPFAQ